MTPEQLGHAVARYETDNFLAKLHGSSPNAQIAALDRKLELLGQHKGMKSDNFQAAMMHPNETILNQTKLATGHNFSAMTEKDAKAAATAYAAGCIESLKAPRTAAIMAACRSR